MSEFLTGQERDLALRVFSEFLMQPSVSATGEGVTEAAELLKQILTGAGVKASVDSTGGHPVVVGELDVGSDRTVMFYNHYDVQPVDPVDQWVHPPFSAQISQGKIYARGASDNKGTLVARVFALKKLVEENRLKVNVKLLVEGEEEIGSPHLEAYVRSKREKLLCDAVVMEGGSFDHEGRPQIVLGVKGLLYVQLDMSTGSRDIHSSYAPIVHNPAQALARILCSLVDENGRVLVPGFYDDVRPLNDTERRLLGDEHVDLFEIRRGLGAEKLRFDDPAEAREALYTHPTCNVDGLSSGYTGAGTKTIVPASAFAKLDFRLVPDQSPAKILDLLKAHLASVGFTGSVSVLGLERPVRTSPSTRIVKAMEASAQRTYKNKPSVVINSAGTQPMGVFTGELGVTEAVSAIGVGTLSSNIHAPNEHVELEHFYKAVEHTALFLEEYSRL